MDILVMPIIPTTSDGSAHILSSRARYFPCQSSRTTWSIAVQTKSKVMYSGIKLWRAQTRILVSLDVPCDRAPCRRLTNRWDGRAPLRWPIRDLRYREQRRCRRRGCSAGNASVHRISGSSDKNPCRTEKTRTAPYAVSPNAASSTW
jgi:hypothetical protein